MKTFLLLITQILRAGAVTLVAAFSLWFFSPLNAFATGGAYVSTKHGGGTVDGIKFDGVNRAINPDYSLYYNDSAEGGQYVSGECAHCHEPHAFFGGTEPAPVTGVPSPYLLMKYGNAGETNYSYLCWYCHENIFGAGGPGTGYWGYYKGMATYQASSHYINLDGGSAMAWPGAGGTNAGVGTTADATQTWPRKPRANSGGNVGSCVNCHTPHGIKNPAVTGYDNGAPATANYLVGTTPVSTNIPRQLIAWEEALCLNCHDADGPASTNIKLEIDKWGYLATTATTSGHPTRQSTYFGRHNPAGLDNLASTTNDNEPPAYTAAGGWFSSTGKHAECVDCHNPHAVQGVGSNAGGFWAAPWGGGVFQWSTGTNNPGNAWNTNRNTDATSSTPVRLAAQNRGVWGVNVNATTGAITGVVSSLQSWNEAVPNFMYQLCIKCHSAWAWGFGGVPGTVAPWNAPSSIATGGFGSVNPSMYTSRTNLSMTDQAWEFATDGIPPPNAAWTSAGKGRVAYHPVFAQGRNRPELYFQQFGGGTRNPCWCANTTCPPTVTSYTTTNGGQGNYGVGDCTNNTTIITGVRAIGARADLTGNMIATLSQNFVPPWMHTSTVGCTDCHEDNSETNPRGPHGSSRPYILRALDTTIQFTKCATANCATTTTYTYGSIADTNNMCLNCHRADVYGYYNTNSVLPNFPRQPHTSFNGGDGFAKNQPSNAPNGILCMICHGGARGRLGTIHGNDYVASTATCPNCTIAGRLIATGAVAAERGEWDSWTKSTVGTAGGCVQNNSPYCGRSVNTNFDVGANYNY